MIFRKSLILDDTVTIEQLWSELLETGTDTYRIKFHNQLINRYKKYNKNGLFARIHENITGKKKNLSEEYKEYMVLIQSYYNAASTYYFSKNYQFAYKVVTDGLNFFNSIREKLYSNDYKTQKKHVDIWNLLLLTLKLDIMTTEGNNFGDTGNVRMAVREEEIKFVQIDYAKPFPSSAVLLFRRHFLDYENNITKDKIQILHKLRRWLNNEKLWTELDDDILYRKHISMYKFLVLFTISSEQGDKLSNILKAIEKPVLSIEDRLLNYKATQLALNHIVKPCIDMTDYNEDMCEKLKNYNSNTGITSIESTIIDKLYFLYNMDTDVIAMLKTELTTDNHIIDQNKLHVIVSASLDINIESEIYFINLNNSSQAIALLIAYTEVHEKKIIKEDEQKKSKNKKSNVTAKMRKSKKFDSNEQLYNQFTSTKYTTYEILNNLFIAYKWLMELFAVQSNNSQFRLYTSKFNQAKNNANIVASKEKELLGSELLVNDEHFIYLKAKQKSKVLLSSDKWEPSNRPGGWVQDRSSKTILKYFDPTEIKKNDILEPLIKLRDNSKSPYINRIEIFTIIFRYHWKLKQDYVAMYTSIKSAISEIVVTPEDRLRNLEAHELFTMYLMDRNEVGIKLSNVLDIGQVYNTFLINPEIRYENNITYKDFWDDEDDDTNIDINNTI
ncbi:uncharacterized protein LOC114126139 isoform X1 [Aphis gossypii]|uniref:uncharacterized protein LOC114126139 isoform X1 n=1 Tax=Aphis gossypii TaxID=80765 RepID=UPI0021595954|nr:uncharacterized protein LOC114126139 isoform X1 [Aphis gossypii]